MIIYGEPKKMRTRWNNAVTDYNFTISNGVNQGGVLLLVLCSLYLDSSYHSPDILTWAVTCMAYSPEYLYNADAIMLLAPSRSMVLGSWC